MSQIERLGRDDFTDVQWNALLALPNEMRRGYLDELAKIGGHDGGRARSIAPQMLRAGFSGQAPAARPKPPVAPPPGWPETFPRPPLSDQKLRGYSSEELQEMYQRLRAQNMHDEANKLQKYQKFHGARNKMKPRGGPVRLPFPIPLFYWFRPGWECDYFPDLPKCREAYLPESGAIA